MKGFKISRLLSDQLLFVQLFNHRSVVDHFRHRNQTSPKQNIRNIYSHFNQVCNILFILFSNMQIIIRIVKLRVVVISVSFKWVTNRTLPTISYLTSLDKYQIISIIYLAMCCVWHSSISTVDLDMPTKTVIDRSVLCVFATVFLTIQVIFGLNIVLAYRKIKEIEKSEAKFIAHVPDEPDDDDEEED